METGLAGYGDELWREGVGGGIWFHCFTKLLGSPLLILPAYPPPPGPIPKIPQNPARILHRT